MRNWEERRKNTMTKYPQIGIHNALAHLHDVLSPAYARFMERGTRANALAVAEAAWALHERYWHENGCQPALPQFREDLYKACPELKLMRDYAETGKHAGLGRGDVQLVSITGAENPGGTLEVTGGFLGDGPLRAGKQHTAECTLTMNCADGTSHSVPDVLKRVVDFWWTELRN